METALDREARGSVMKRLANAYDEVAVIAQKLIGAGYAEDAEVAHDQALRLLIAYDVEANDPTPVGLER